MTIRLIQKINSYLETGIGADYLIKYKEKFKHELLKKETTVYKSAVDEFNKLTFNGFVGFGMDYKNVSYIEFNYYPALTKNIDDYKFTVISRYYELSIGCNINNLRKKKQ